MVERLRRLNVQMSAKMQCGDVSVGVEYGFSSANNTAWLMSINLPRIARTVKATNTARKSRETALDHVANLLHPDPMQPFNSVPCS